MPEFLLPFLTAFSLSVASLSVALFVSRRFSFPSRLEGARKHKPVPRLGGLAVAAAFLLAVFPNGTLERSPAFLGLFAGVSLIVAFGALDDLVPIHWMIQLVFQSGLAVSLFFFGMRIWVVTNPFGDPLFLRPEARIFPSLLIGVAFTVLVMNAMNWVDGVDGLLGGVSSVAFLSIFVVSLRPEVNQPAVGILSLSMFGVSLAFLIFNAPPARILAGTTGSFFFGFAVSALALYSGAKIATILLTLSVPVLDALFVIRRRIIAGQSPFHGGDERHFHDKLRQAGWTDRSIAALYTSVSAFSAAVALSLPAAGKLLFLLALGFAFVFFLYTIERKIEMKTP